MYRYGEYEVFTIFFTLDGATVAMPSKFYIDVTNTRVREALKMYDKNIAYAPLFLIE